MDRRNFFTAGAVATAAAGIATMAGTKPASASTAGFTTIFDFGAHADGTTDDGPAFNAAIAWAAQNARIVLVPGGTYAIRTPIRWLSQGDVASLWGLEGLGAKLVSMIGGGQDVISLQSQNTVRYMKFSGMSIVGSGQDGNGLRMFVPGTSAYFYNCVIENVSVERVGKSGLLMEGNVAENTVLNSYFQDNQYGATFACSQGGVCSAITLINCYFNQNAVYGMQAANFDAQYGGTTDVRVYGGYCRDNKSYGFYYNNGGGTGGIINVGFENNCHGLQPGDTNGAHVYSQGGIRLKNCQGYNETGGATYLLAGWFGNLVVMDDCSQNAGGAMAAAGPARLVKIYGPSNSLVLVRASSGQIDTQPGNGCPWTAQNCSGASPSGIMSLVNTLTG